LRQDAERNRRRILDAALELFAERGLGATLNDVARHAGVGVGTVYRRFPDKWALLDELFEERLAEIVGAVDAALEEPDPWEALSGFLTRALEIQAADRAVKELILTSPEGMEMTARMRAALFPRVSRLVARAQEAGQLRADFAPSDIPLLMLMIGTIIDLGRDGQPDLWRRPLNLVLQGMRAQPVAPTPIEAPALAIEQLPVLLAAQRKRR
jgi:AcrR family transcriptional regulator